jgi:hypothetical protein
VTSGVVCEARCLQAMHGVIDRQPFSLNPWTTCDSFISWLRFFSFTGLVLGCISGTLLSSQYTRVKKLSINYTCCTETLLEKNPCLHLLEETHHHTQINK